MTIFEHLDGIDSIITQAKQEIGNLALLAAGGNMGSSVGQNFAGGAGTLHSNAFGSVYSGNSPFSVGQINNHGGVGAMRSDVFGNVYAGNSPFSVGKINNHGQAGELHSDVFGQIRVGDSPFVSGQL